MVKSYVPDRGDLVLLDFNPQSGKEQAGKRPALVLTPRSYNQKVGLCLFCPITSQTKGYPFEVLIPTGLRVYGVILSDHVKNLDWKFRNASFLDRLPEESLTEVLSKLEVLIFSH